MSEKVIRDSIHGDIYLTDPVILELIDTPEFQRLRRISQLAGAQFAYPGATHTRFSHSLGVYYVIGEFLKNSDLAKKTTQEEKLLVKIAGLLHDIGHGPFSHSFEKVTNKNHEQYSIDLITNPEGNIFKVLTKYAIDPFEVGSIISGTYKNQYISLLVSSQIDADRLDYLMRDAYYAGVNYASIDISFLVRNLTIVDDKIAFSKKAIYAIESFLLGRYHMFKQVYNHKISLGFDVLLTKWSNRVKDLLKENYVFKAPEISYFFQDLSEDKTLDLQKYVELDDGTMYELFKLSTKEDDPILVDLADRILNRRFFRTVPSEQENKETILTELNQANLNPDYYFAEVNHKPITIYQDGEVSGKDETIYLFDKYTLEPLSKLTIFEKSMFDINNMKSKKYFLFGIK